MGGHGDDKPKGVVEVEGVGVGVVEVRKCRCFPFDVKDFSFNGRTLSSGKS